MLTKKKVVFVVYLVLFAYLMTIIIYPFLHESGHLITATICGGKTNGIKLGFLQASAYFSGDFTNSQLFLIHISGAVFPLLIWLIYIISIPKNVYFALEGFKIVFSGTVIGSMLAWVVIPILFELNKAPAEDDVVKFMRLVNINGFLVSSIFLIITVFSVILFIKKLGNIKDILK